MATRYPDGGPEFQSSQKFGARAHRPNCCRSISTSGWPRTGVGGTMGGPKDVAMKEADMAQATAAIINKPAWIDLSTKDPEWSRDFYAKVFGWQVEVNQDPQYGGYAHCQDRRPRRRRDRPDPDARTPRPPGTSTSAPMTSTDLAKRVKAAGGTVVAAPFDVGDQGSMAVFQDPSGAFISGWQGTRMGGFQTRRRECVRLGRAQRPRSPAGAVVLHERVRLDDQDERHGRREPALYRVPARRAEHRRCDGDEPDGAGRGAELLDGLLRSR